MAYLDYYKVEPGRYFVHRGRGSEAIIGRKLNVDDKIPIPKKSNPQDFTGLAQHYHGYNHEIVAATTGLPPFKFGFFHTDISVEQLPRDVDIDKEINFLNTQGLSLEKRL